MVAVAFDFRTVDQRSWKRGKRAIAPASILRVDVSYRRPTDAIRWPVIASLNRSSIPAPSARVLNVCRQPWFGSMPGSSWTVWRTHLAALCPLSSAWAVTLLGLAMGTSCYREPTHQQAAPEPLSPYVRTDCHVHPSCREAGR